MLALHCKHSLHALDGQLMLLWPLVIKKGRKQAIGFQ